MARQYEESRTCERLTSILKGKQELIEKQRELLVEQQQLLEEQHEWLYGESADTKRKRADDESADTKRNRADYFLRNYFHLKKENEELKRENQELKKPRP